MNEGGGNGCGTVEKAQAGLEGFLVHFEGPGFAALVSTSGSALTVSARKLSFQPQQTRESPKAAFFHEIGLLKQTRRTTRRASCRSPQ